MKKDVIQLSDHFTLGRLFRFCLPSVVMMVFTSIYGVVDGYFVSNFVGKTPFAAVNLIMPFLMILGGVGFMIGTGGSALVAKYLGEQNNDQARRVFSMMLIVTLILGVSTSALGIIFAENVAQLLGADSELLPYCVTYARTCLIFNTMFMLQNVFQSFLITAEKPHFGLGVTVAAGLTNIILDFLFIAVFRWGVAGAAIATAASQFVGGGVPLLYFARPNRSLLRLGKTKLDSRALLKACTNGSSELMTNLSSSLVTVLYNFQLMQLAGEDGIAAYGVIMYVNFIFIAIFIGYSIGSAPVVGYHHGAGNSTELKSLFRKSLLLVGAAGVALTAAAEALALPLTKIFVGYDAALLAMTCRGFRLYSLSFLLTGFNIFSSGFFTALNDGFVSAVISFLRTLVFQTAVVLVLPALMGTDGIWLAIVVAELLALAVSAWFLWRKRGKYRYA